MFSKLLKIFLGILFIQPTCSFSQNNKTTSTEKHQLGLRHDNDFIVLTDRYYSSGLYLNYHYRPKTGLLAWSKSEQFSALLLQQVFTPTDVKSLNVEDYDRPYAEFSAIDLGWQINQESSLINTSLQLGLSGNKSGAGGFQRWYHRAIVISDPPVWKSEIRNQMFYNFYGNYTKEWTLSNNPFGVVLAATPQIALGNKDIYIEPKIAAFFGRRNVIDQTIAYQNISTVREIFFSFNFSYRYVNKNFLLEGTSYDNPSFNELEPKRNIYKFGFDFMHRINFDNYWVGYRWQSSETIKTDNHHYVILSYSRIF